MITISFQTIFLSTLQILLLGAVGFCLVRTKVVDEPGLGVLTKLLINLLLPCFIFYHLTVKFSYELFPNWWKFPLMSAAMTFLGFILSRIVFVPFKQSKLKDQFAALISFQNCGIIPFLIVAGIFIGENARVLYIYIFLFAIGFDLLLWTLGVWLLNREHQMKMELKKVFNPPFLTTTLTLLAIFLGLHKLVPATILEPVRMLGDCTLTVSMLIVGGNLSFTNLKQIQMSPLIGYLLIKLGVLPILAFILLANIKMNSLVGFLIMVEASMPSAVSLSFMSRYYKVDGEFINQAIFFSHIISVVTIPLFLMAYVKFILGQ